MKKSKNLWAVILFILWVIFIFTRSMQPADLSNEESGKVLSILEQLLPFELSNHIVRKLAHFIEYAILGFLGWFVYVPQPQKYKIGFFTLLTCVAVSICDETIQVFVDGRAGRVSDVCLDTVGALTGVLAGGVIMILRRRMRRKWIK